MIRLLFFQTVEQSRLPFKITLEPLAEFTVIEDGYHYSYTGIKIVFQRNNLGVLEGGFYFPTLVFSLLSLLSFAIKPEMVSYCIIFSFILTVFQSRIFFSSLNNNQGLGLNSQFAKIVKFILGSWSTWFTDHTVFDCF